MTEQKLADLYARFNELDVGQLQQMRNEHAHKLANMQLLAEAAELVDELEVICNILAERERGVK